MTLADTYGTPGHDTVAVIIDMRDATSSIVEIYQEASGDHLDVVNMDFKGELVIVPWRKGWSYSCSGSCTVAEVKDETGTSN